MDELAYKLEIDPLEFRSLNAAKEGTRRVNGLTFRKVGFLEVLESARNHPHYKSKISGANSGRGIAAAVSFNMSGESCAVGNVNSDGTVSLLEGSPDIGGTRATVAMQMAEVLGLPAEDIHPSIGDTDTIGFTAYTAGSSVTYKTGWACFEAAQDIKRQMIERAAVLWEVPKSEIRFQNGILIHVSDPELQISFKDLSAILNQIGGPVVGRANINLGGESPGFTVHMVDVEVDPETGKTKILRYTAIQDVGTAIHPGYVEGQMQGAASQGIGWALNEEYFLDDQGRMQNSSLLDYRLPTSLDLPMIDTVVVEIKDPTHPFGVRGVGEVSIIPPVPALANAIHQALGIRMSNLPMSPGAVLDRLWRKAPNPDA
jgi:CO/xanthine dehydrogenase Mo-binding subunit